MTILYFDDITALAYFVERMTRTDDPGPQVTNVELAVDYLADACDKLTAAVKELDNSLRSLVSDPTPQYGEHIPGLITPRKVDNAEMSGANLSKYLNNTKGRAPCYFLKSAPGTQPVKAGGIFLLFPFRALFCTFAAEYFQQPPTFYHFRARLCTFGNYLFSP